MDFFKRLFKSDDEPQLAGAASVVKTIAKSVRFATGNQLDQHKAFFAATAVGEEYVTSTIEPTQSSVGESWEVVAEWDASHHVPKRGDGQRTNRPGLIGWSPMGDKLVTACDAFGLTRWHADGRRVGGGTSPSAYGSPTRFFWSPDGRLVLLEAQTAQNDWWSVQDEWGILIHQVVATGARWGRDSMNTYHLNRNRCFNPWRPGREQILLEGDLSRACLDSFDVVTLPKTSRVSGTLVDIPPGISVDFSQLGAQDQDIFRYSWDPSGQYVAVTTGNRDKPNARHIHICHYESGEIVASIPPTTVALGWSPAGRLLVCEQWAAPYTSALGTEVRVWDSHEWQLRDLTEKERSTGWARQLIFSGRGERDDALSADGERVLKELTPVPDGRQGLRIVKAKGGEQLFDLPGEGGVAHAAWSPTDPYCFATVGGKDAPRSLRIWSLGKGTML